MSWAETTASEMSLRAELCALRDEYSSVSGDASALRKRCEALQRENTELGERCGVGVVLLVDNYLIVFAEGLFGWCAASLSVFTAQGRRNTFSLNAD